MFKKNYSGHGANQSKFKYDLKLQKNLIKFNKIDLIGENELQSKV